MVAGGGFSRRHRIDAGRAGFYLASLRQREYYYCELDPSDVYAKLNELGIGMKSTPEQAI